MRRDPETFGRPCGGVRRPAPNVADFPHRIYLRADKVGYLDLLKLGAVDVIVPDVVVAETGEEGP